MTDRSRQRAIYRLAAGLCLCLLVAGCVVDQSTSEGFSAPSSLPSSTDTAPPAGGAPATPAPIDSGWLPAGAGIEYRSMRVPHAGMLASVHVVRLEQGAVGFRVGYAPDAPRFLADWCSDAGVLAAINGGFFNADHRSTALVVSDGVAYGSSYQGQGGMFAVDVWGNVSLRYLPDTPYNPAEPLSQAVQGWPMLIRPGRGVLYPGGDDSQRARRSVVAMDRSGRVLLLAFPGNDFTLHELADWLMASDLDLDSALNLDGGSSTGLCVQTDSRRERVDAFVPLPIALQVRPR